MIWCEADILAMNLIAFIVGAIQSIVRCSTAIAALTANSVAFAISGPTRGKTPIRLTDCLERAALLEIIFFIPSKLQKTRKPADLTLFVSKFNRGLHDINDVSE